MSSIALSIFNRDELPGTMLEAAKPYENKFGDHFETFLYFSKELFGQLHDPGADPLWLPAEVTVASQSDPTILTEMEIFRKVANAPLLTAKMKRDYYAALLAIYKKLPRQPQKMALDAGTCCVGIEREGRILAEAIGCLPPERSLTPHAKRIPYEGGLLVGWWCKSPPVQRYENCVIIDGAIASGATLMATLMQLKRIADSFHIYSIHGPCEGLRAIVTFAKKKVSMSQSPSDT